MAKFLKLFYVMVFFFSLFILMTNCDTCDDKECIIRCQTDSDCPLFMFCYHQICHHS
ncbi:putative Late nodulin [Lupinus albus]|uniref:Putative Late nodulin n=1 Tax=Lupinus albus TaxID=3870 RepID=A0A6A4QBU1_LUPAL|nr:putative Late nodulin [Lupinus albus]